MTDVAEIQKRLRARFGEGPTRPIEWRKEQLAGLRRMLVDHQDEFVAALRTDLGRPTAEAIGADLGHAKGELRHMIRHVERWARPRRVRVPALIAPAKGYVRPEPLGVALVIAPWNYPIQLLIEPMAAALAAGNCVVAKPSELSPACSAALARLVPRFVDNDAVAVVEGGVPETTALLDEPWDHIFFTGSTPVGRVVAAAAAKHLTPATLELGGKSPTYVNADADLDVAARRIAWGKFLNAGQTCIAPDYVLADRSIRDQLVDGIASAVHGFYGDDPRSSGSYGRIVNDRHFDRLSGLMADGAGDVVTGGDRDRPTRYFAPTVTVDPDPAGPLMSDEIFGPILPVLAVDGVDEAVSFITSRPKPLALYVFTESDDTAEVVLSRTSSGGAVVNHALVHLLPPDLPFGGVGASGYGAYHGKTGFDTFSHAKSVVHKPVKPDPAFLYPPYTRFKQWLITKTLR
ncbi:MAG: aldehyde dehydrogenase family protein [Acidimicrobiales bacterium]